jgi:hypothetical protein
MTPPLTASEITAAELAAAEIMQACEREYHDGYMAAVWRGEGDEYVRRLILEKVRLERARVGNATREGQA